MTEIDTTKRALRVVSDSMYDPADPHDSLIAGDIIIVESGEEARDGDLVVVALEGNESVMKVVIRDGVRSFGYTAPDRSNFRLTDAAVVTGVVTMRLRRRVTDFTGPLKWLGDNIGLRNDRPVLINLADSDARPHTVSLWEALLAARQIDAYGMQRIASALSYAAEHGDLRPMDLDVWNDLKSDHEINEPREACHA